MVQQRPTWRNLFVMFSVKKSTVPWWKPASTWTCPSWSRFADDASERTANPTLLIFNAPYMDPKSRMDPILPNNVIWGGDLLLISAIKSKMISIWITMSMRLKLGIYKSEKNQISSVFDVDPCWSALVARRDVQPPGEPRSVLRRPGTRDGGTTIAALEGKITI